MKTQKKSEPFAIDMGDPTGDRWAATQVSTTARLNTRSGLLYVEVLGNRGHSPPLARPGVLRYVFPQKRYSDVSSGGATSTSRWRS